MGTIDTAPQPPRVRVNVKQLASGKWQPEITIESYDADPDTPEGRESLFRRLDGARSTVDAAIEHWEATGNG
jgi:hypothetical protein